MALPCAGLIFAGGHHDSARWQPWRWLVSSEGGSFLAHAEQGCPGVWDPSGLVGPGAGSAGRVVSTVLPQELLVVVVRARLAAARWAGGPAGEQAQCVVRGGTGLGGVGEQALARFGGDREGFEREIEIPDDRVVDELDAGGVDPDVVGGPPGRGTGRCGWTAPRSGPTAPVVGIAAGLGAQQGDSLAGDLVPVAEELGGVRVEEEEPGVVGRPDRIGVNR